MKTDDPAEALTVISLGKDGLGHWEFDGLSLSDLVASLRVLRSSNVREKGSRGASAYLGSCSEIVPWDQQKR